LARAETLSARAGKRYQEEGIGMRILCRRFSRSRRRTLLGAVCAGAAVTGLRSWTAVAAAAADQPLITKTIPSSGERIPAIGLGTDAFQASEREVIRDEIERMSELGGSVIDTAAAYGDSESLIGAAVAELGIRDKLFIATKLTDGGGGYAGDLRGEQSFERSLERLRLPRVDLLQVHNLSGIDTLMPRLLSWKRAGKIRYIGATTSRVAQHKDLVDAMHRYPLDFVQVDYSLANRDAAGTVLPAALERRMAVFANLPLARSALFSQAGSHALPAWASDIDVSSWGQFFLKYVISHPAVSCAIPGSTKLAHLEDNQQAARGRLPDETMRVRMERYWDDLT